MNKIEQLTQANTAFLTKDLNPAQQEAVTLPVEGHALILAGAGSGKTKVLTHRIAWLILHHNIAPSAICSVTFTNKAANEMKTRLHTLMQQELPGLWCGTFHGINHRFLRIHYEHAKLSKTFQIMDSDDQLSLIRRIMRDLQIDPKINPPKTAANFINSHKDQGLRAYTLSAQNNWEALQLEVYHRYELLCNQSNLVDFAEILLRSYEALKENLELLKQYQGRFSHLLIDEFQDTNTLQYKWIKLLNGTLGNTFIVGDDDQSIYGWRGAKIENIQSFNKEFSKYKPVTEVCLEQNYRSTKPILSCANQLIAKNEDRLGKNLWTNIEGGEAVKIYAAVNGHNEADFVIKEIEHALENNMPGNHIAILYRSNAQSRLFEESLLKNKIPYTIYGGVRFFERAEIKDLLAYLRLVINPDDNAAFLRIINTPPRGIGNKTLETITQIANDEEVSYWQSAQKIKHPSLEKFIALITQWQKEIQKKEVEQQLDYLYKQSELISHYEKESKEKAEIREENIQELIIAAREYEDGNELISHAILEAGEQPVKTNHQAHECVQLMTLHSSKGLEFPLVFMVGMEDGLFPTTRSLDAEHKITEERRLAYVGMTRAREQLFLTFAGYRQLYGNQFSSFPVSRFIRDLPEEYIEIVEI
jgi:DNA helicase-2/ATP-dependent DNA helicase PcrA